MKPQKETSKNEKPKKTVKQKKKPEYSHPVISFDDSLGYAHKIKAAGGIAKKELLEKIFGNKGGWLALQIGSLIKWGLIVGRGEYKLTDDYKYITNPIEEDGAAKTAQKIFLNIPLFKEIYEKYKDHGLPQEPYLTNTLRNEFGLTGRNPKLVANIIREFVSKYFEGHEVNNLGIEESNTPKTTEQKLNENQPAQAPKEFKMPEGEYPIVIFVGKEEPFKWNIKVENDWEVINKVIESLRNRWKKDKGDNKMDSKDKS